jgi:hypothetical protein
MHHTSRPLSRLWDIVVATRVAVDDSCRRRLSSTLSLLDCRSLRWSPSPLPLLQRMYMPCLSLLRLCWLMLCC